MKLAAAKFLLILSFFAFIYGGYLIWERTNTGHYSIFPEQLPTRISGQPDTIIIPSAQISLPIYPATIHGVKWDQTTKGVSYLQSSPLPGRAGNSILYGHNWQNLLGHLHNVKPGQKIFVRYGSTTLAFTITYTGVVTDHDISILAPTKDTRLTIYTCTGFLDRQRLVVTALRDPS